MQFFGYIASWLALMAGIRGLVGYIESHLRPCAKSKLEQWVFNLDIRSAISNWAESFVELFDCTFGKRHLSWKCFSRSAFASMISIAILSLLLQERVFDYIHAFTKPAYANVTDSTIISYTVFLFLVNFVADYFSLLETRYLLKKFISMKGVFGIILLIVIDLVLTYLIWEIFFSFIFCFVYVSFWMLCRGAFLAHLKYLCYLVISGRVLSVVFSPIIPGGIVVVLFLSTFLTSVWIWFYIVAALIASVGKFFGRPFKVLRRIFNVKENPLHFLGIMVSLLVTALYILVPFIRFLIEKAGQLGHS